jgi:hypothetical protein
MEFKERSLKVIVDIAKCPECTTKACVEACKVYDRELIQIKDGHPSVDYISPEEVIRRGTECLACELACRQRGKDAIRIEIPIKGLDDYLAGKPLTGGMS